MDLRVTSVLLCLVGVALPLFADIISQPPTWSKRGRLRNIMDVSPVTAEAFVSINITAEGTVPSESSVPATFQSRESSPVYPPTKPEKPISPPSPSRGETMSLNSNITALGPIPTSKNITSPTKRARAITLPFPGPETNSPELLVTSEPSATMIIEGDTSPNKTRNISTSTYPSGYLDRVSSENPFETHPQTNQTSSTDTTAPNYPHTYAISTTTTTAPTYTQTYQTSTGTTAPVYAQTYPTPLTATPAASYPQTYSASLTTTAQSYPQTYLTSLTATTPPIYSQTYPTSLTATTAPLYVVPVGTATKAITSNMSNDPSLAAQTVSASSSISNSPSPSTAPATTMALTSLTSSLATKWTLLPSLPFLTTAPIAPNITSSTLPTTTPAQMMASVTLTPSLGGQTSPIPSNVTNQTSPTVTLMTTLTRQTTSMGTKTTLLPSDITNSTSSLVTTAPMIPNITNYTPTTTAGPMSLNSTTVKTEPTSFTVSNETSPSTIFVPIMSNLLSNTTQATLSFPSLSNIAGSTLSTTITVPTTSNDTKITLQGNTLTPTVSNNTGSTSTSRTLSLNTTILQVAGTILSNTTDFTSLATKTAPVTPLFTKIIIPDKAATASNVTGATSWPAESNTSDAPKWPNVTRLLSPAATTTPITPVLSTSISLDGRTAAVMSNVSQYALPSITAVPGTSDFTRSVAPSSMSNITGSAILDSRTAPITSKISTTLGSTTVAATMKNATGLMSTVDLNMSPVVGSTPVPSQIFGSSSMATKTAPMISDVTDSAGNKTTDSISNKSAVTLTSTITPPITTNITFVGPAVPPTAPLMNIASTSPVSKTVPIIYTVNGASSPTAFSTISDTTSRPSAPVNPTTLMTQYTPKVSLPNRVSENNTIPVMSGISVFTSKPTLEKVSTTAKTPEIATTMLAASKTTGAPLASTTTIPNNTRLTNTITTFSTGTEPVNLNFPTSKTSTASTLEQVNATKTTTNITDGTTEMGSTEAVTLGTYETNSRGILALRLKLDTSAIYPFTTQNILKLICSKLIQDLSIKHALVTWGKQRTPTNCDTYLNPSV